MTTTTDIKYLPETAPLQTLAEYSSYADAQRAVDRLSDSGLPLENVRIVGHDMKSVESVRGRMTKGRAAGLGAASGAWFGLFIGLFLGLFLPAPAWLSLLLAGLLIGALFGAVFGFFGHWATRGERDFTSDQALVASRYEVLVEPQLLVRARQALVAA